MRKKKWQHAKTIGNIEEEKIKTMALNSGLTIDQENVVDGAKRRKKGKVDHIYLLGDDKRFNNEIKRSEDGRYTVCFRSEDHDIKWSQVEYLMKRYKQYDEHGGFTFVMPSKTPIFVHINDFMFWYTNSKYKHIKYEEAVKIGLEITDMDWVKDYEYKIKVVEEEQLRMV